ncbi:Uncharacterised protein [Klebsiella pneumoniae]|nr:Uncharacterised protein [Klebsiella pneumoniae]
MLLLYLFLNDELDFYQDLLLLLVDVVYQYLMCLFLDFLSILIL